MKFCLNLDDIDSEDDSLGVEVEGGFDGNMETRELLSNDIPVCVQIGATGRGVNQAIHWIFRVLP